MKYFLLCTRVLVAAMFVAVLVADHCSGQSLASAGSALAGGSGLPDDQAPMFKVNVSLVNLNVTVTDGHGLPVRGLEKDDFAILEDGLPQVITSFHEDAETPMSVGVLFDVSQSMTDKIDRVRQALNNFCDTIKPQDEVFLIRFNNKVNVVQDYTDDRKKLRKAAGALRPKGETALYDAIIEGLQHLQGSKYDKRALFVITDGRDTKSKAKLRDVVEAAHRSTALIYSLALGSEHPQVNGVDDSVDYDTLRTIASASGGKAFLITSRKTRDHKDAINAAALAVSSELRNQYTLAYYPPPAKRDGEYRHIKVNNRNPEYAVRARTGYLTVNSRQ